MSRSRPRIAVPVAIAISIALATPGLAYQRHAVGGAFDAPIYISHAPGRANLLFVAEEPGTIRVLRKGRRLARPFLDMRDRAFYEQGGEQGLLSMAFAPDYARTRRFYVFFTNNHCSPREGATACDLEIDEYRSRAGHPARADASSRRIVITIRHRDAYNHNGGTIMFGADRKLWIGVGDGGCCNDDFDHASRRNSLLGKLLRIDPRRSRSGKRGYRIPRSNPFAGKVRGRGEIWSIGFRNPFRFSFDRRRKALLIADVGQDAVEELDYATIARAKGANFGWPSREGDIAGPHPGRRGTGRRIGPAFTIDHSTGACAATGGLIARDPRLHGRLRPAAHRYVFGDYCRVDSPFALKPRLGPPAGASPFSSLGIDALAPVAFGEDARRRIYVASGGAIGDGHVYRIDP